MTELFCKFYTVCRTHGIRHGIAVAKRYWMSREITTMERTYNIDLNAILPTNEMSVVGSNQKDGFFYGPSNPRLIRACFRALGQSLANTSIVDVGSGKGIVLLLASHAGFQEVIGVEHGQKLHEIAQVNCQRYFDHHHVLRPPKLVLGDATQASYPSTDAVFYFCNPFSERIMKETIDRILSFRKSDLVSFRFVVIQLIQEDDESKAESDFATTDDIHGSLDAIRLQNRVL